MSDLIERLEALTGPCRECDQEIGVFVRNLDRPESAPRIIGVANCPPYTASIDRAMTLVPDGAKLTFQNHGDIAGRSLWLVEPNERFSSGATPAIALCIAALKATQ